MPIAFYYNHLDLSVQKSITNQIKDFYFDGQLTHDKGFNVTNVITIEFRCTKNANINNISYTNLQLFSDGWFLTAMDHYLRLRLGNTNAAPTFVYLLTHFGSVSHTDIFHGDPETIYGKFMA